MASDPADTLRALLLALVAFGALGLLVELALLEHWAALAQWVPLTVLTLALVAAIRLALRTDARRLRQFRGAMALAVLAGLVGLGLHLSDNLAFEREVAPDASLGSLLWEAAHGATPLLAPGSLVQLGLVGLILTWRHPVLRRDSNPAGAGVSFERAPQENP